MKMVFLAIIIRYRLCMIFFVQKSFLTKNYFLIVEINLTTRGPLYTCLVSLDFASPLECVVSNGIHATFLEDGGILLTSLL